MAAYIRQRPASWFRLVGIAVTLWGIAGCAAWLAARLGIVLAPPGWAFALAAGSVLGGGIALLNKKLFARVLFAIALLAAAGEIAWLAAVHGLVAGPGLLAGLIVMGAVPLLWLAEHSRRHGWIS